MRSYSSREVIKLLEADGWFLVNTLEVSNLSKKERLYFPAIFSYSPNEEISVFFPDLDVATSGVDDRDAFDSARELLGCVIYGVEEDNERLPAPTPLNELHLDPNERACLIDVFMPSVRLAEENRSISRTVTLPAWLNAMA